MIKADPPRPTIKSFVRRTGRLTSGQRIALREYWPLYGINFQDSFIDIESLTNGFQSLKLEIGFGNGEALVSMAKGDPTAFYLGAEVHESGVGRCLNSIHERSLTNVRLIKHDAIEVMQKMLPMDSLDRVLLFFPDPWHKRRHNKRRIVNRKFRDLLASLLKPGGCVHMATDWQEYAEHMAVEMHSDARFVSLGDDKGYSIKPDYRPLTHFEERGLKLGHGVWDLVFRKR